jgi:predicted porin
MNPAFNHSSIRLTVAAAALCALASQAEAQSSLTIYGAVGLDVISASKVSNLAGTKGKSMIKLDDNAIVNSRIGFKGVEDLGGGVKTIFDLESTIKPDTGSTGGTFWNRNAFVGLTGAAGSLKLGHQWNVADDYMCGYFVCAYYSPFLMPGFYAISDYYDNSIKYTSPNYGGFEGALMYTLGEKSASKTAGNKVQLAVNYGAGPVGAGAVYFTEKDPSATGKSNKMVALGGSYDFGVAKARLGYAKAKVEYGTAFKASLYDLGVDVPVSDAYAVSADYVMNNKSESKDDTSFLRLRGSYALSKRTSLNANLIFLKNSGNAAFAFLSEKSGFEGIAGQKQTILTAGITHAF